ncbi:MAG: hypothetical protein MUF84_13725, partial [Anaerolineae bacterium]|nr:hypothetical protein [Anaerolineae bacterium]
MPQSDITLPLWPIAIISAVLDEEMQAWLVGGAVRDLVLAHQPRDWDFVVTGSGLRAARAVANKLGGAYYALDVERQTGRAIVTDPASGLRVTLDFAALRHATIEDDLLARDFTINAMAASFDGRILDPTGGFGDVIGRVLRMVSPTCFQADGVRLVRAVRLVAQFGLMLEHTTRARIAAEAGAITNAAPERVRAELVALVALPAAATALALLVELGLVD